MNPNLLSRWEGHPEHALRDVIVLLCAFSVLFSVGWSFANYHARRAAVRVRRSSVDTLTMLLFFVVFSLALGREVGVIKSVPKSVEWIAVACGLCLVVSGCWVNVLGRHQLGSTWANQVTLYREHQLITGGWFAVVRHPLYASLIWMFLGTAVAFLNVTALLLTCLVFIPAMHYRAGQEEQLLLGTFPDYEEYCRRTGRFFPRIRLA